MEYKYHYSDKQKEKAAKLAKSMLKRTSQSV